MRSTAFLPALAAASVLCACGGTAPASPSFEPLFAPVEGELMTTSSPALADLTGDGVADIVFGAGVDRLRPEAGRYVIGAEPAVPGYVVAVSGASGAVLWRAPHPGDAFTTPRFADLDGDGVPDVVMGGREGALVAYRGTDGGVLWRADPGSVAATPVAYNFFTPAFIADADGDGVPELIVVYGGDDTRLPDEPREAGYLAVISGASGRPIATVPTPDGNESYASVVVYPRADGADWLIFGTGGETHGGAAWRAPVASLLDGTFAGRVQRLIEPGAEKGVMAPPTLLELTGDGEADIVISTFDGRLLAIDGASGALLWQRADAGEESYHPAAVVRLPAGRLGLMLSRGIGEFPRYTGSRHRLLDATDGRVLYSYSDPFFPAGAPLAADITGDSVDEAFFFSVRYPLASGAKIHVLEVAERRLGVHELETNAWSTPLIAAPRGAALELIGVSWSLRATADSPDWRHLRWQLFRLDLNAAAPPVLSWAAYMGTRQDGRYPPSQPRPSARR